MKKLIYTLFVVVGLSSFGFSQEASNTAVTKGATELESSKEFGKYTFELPKGITTEDVTKNSNYYTHYFSVSFDANSNKATVEMVENISKNRFVVARFLTACGVKYVQVGDDLIEMHEFIEEYLK